jgi:hypothetical protein
MRRTPPNVWQRGNDEQAGGDRYTMPCDKMAIALIPRSAGAACDEHAILPGGAATRRARARRKRDRP